MLTYFLLNELDILKSKNLKYIYFIDTDNILEFVVSFICSKKIFSFYA